MVVEASTMVPVEIVVERPRHRRRVDRKGVIEIEFGTAPSAPTFDRRIPLLYPSPKRQNRRCPCLSIAIMTAVLVGKPKPRQTK